MSNSNSNSNNDIKYFQPSFFDTHPDFGNEEEMLIVDRQQDEEMSFWAEDFDDDASDSEDFNFFEGAERQEIEWQEVFDEYENVN